MYYFIDEIDTIARPRMADMGFGGSIDHNATINQLFNRIKTALILRITISSLSVLPISLKISLIRH